MGERDEELLKQAARAVNGDCWHPLTHGKPWNPLTDDGDALRLAVKLNLRVDCYDDQVETMDGCEPYKIGPETLRNTFCKVELVDSTQDRYAATRRAIVRAAASLAPKDTHA